MGQNNNQNQGSNQKSQQPGQQAGRDVNTSSTQRDQRTSSDANRQQQYSGKKDM
jgi:hypothetical protein